MPRRIISQGSLPAIPSACAETRPIGYGPRCVSKKYFWHFQRMLACFCKTRQPAKLLCNCAILVISSKIWGFSLRRKSAAEIWKSHDFPGDFLTECIIFPPLTLWKNTNATYTPPRLIFLAVLRCLFRQSETAFPCGRPFMLDLLIKLKYNPVNDYVEWWGTGAWNELLL